MKNSIHPGEEISIVLAILGLRSARGRRNDLAVRAVRSSLAAIAAMLVLSTLPATAQIEKRRVQFAPGTSSAVVEGELQGDEVVDYLLNARVGQAANISMAASTGVASFNLIAPSERDVAFFIGSQQGNQFEGVLPESGDYRVRVYLMGDQAPTTYRLQMVVADLDGRAAPTPSRKVAAGRTEGPAFWEVVGVSTSLNIRSAPSTTATVVDTVPPGTILTNIGCLDAEGRRWCEVGLRSNAPYGYVAAAFLQPAAAPPAAPTTPQESTAYRAGQGQFDARGQIPCAQHRGQPMAQCDFAVARGPGGEATVVVTKPDGLPRALFFDNGAFVSADTSQADGYPEYSASKEADLFLIRVGDERYDIPDAVVFGG